jgi:fatty acid desaturase
MRRPRTAGASAAVHRAFGRDLVARVDDLCARGRVIGPVDLLRDGAACALTVTIGVLADNPMVTVLCVLYVGLRQRQLSNLTHECIHTKFTRSRRTNTAFGYLLTLALGEPWEPYQRTHRIHHALLGGATDPMLQSYLARRADQPWSDKRSFVLHVIVQPAVTILPRSGLLTLIAKSPMETWRSAVTRWMVWTGSAAAAAWCGQLTVFVVYWAAPLILVRPVATWLTDLGNHAGIIHDQDVVRQTRGWTSHWLTRHLLGGHNDDMFHPIHHWFPRLGWHEQPAAARILAAEFPRWHEVPWCSGYFTRRRSTPEVPCVLDDIIARLQHVDIPGA